MDFSKLFSDGIVIVSVKTHQLGTTAKLSPEAKAKLAEANGMNTEWLNATKKIAESPILKALSAQKTAFCQWVKEHAVPAEEFIRAGCYFLNRALIPDLETMHAQTAANLDALTVELAAAWEDVKDTSRRALGPEWREDLLPAADTLADEFKVEYSIFEISLPKDMDPTTHRRELDKLNGSLKSAFREVELTLRDEMIATGTNAGLLVALKRRLDSFGTAKGDRFREALLTNIVDWCERIPTRNISENPQLAQLADLVYLDVSKWSVETFRDSATEREKASERIAYFIAQFDRI